MNQFRVLLIDDDPVMQGIVMALLAKEPSISARSCSAGEEGLAICSTWRPDLLVCDVYMPTLTGPEVLARLRQSPATAGIPVIFTSGSSNPDDVTKWMSLGAADVIAKPFKLRGFVDILRDHLGIDDDAGNDASLAPVAYDFPARLASDAVKLEAYRTELAARSAIPDQLRTCVHQLAGTAGIYGRDAVGAAASAVENAIINTKAGSWTVPAVESALSRLLDCIKRETGSSADVPRDQAVFRATSNTGVK